VGATLSGSKGEKVHHTKNSNQKKVNARGEAEGELLVTDRGCWGCLKGYGTQLALERGLWIGLRSGIHDLQERHGVSTGTEGFRRERNRKALSNPVSQ